MKLKHHIKKAHKIGKFRCEYCDEVSYEWVKYKTHRETVHKELLKKQGQIFSVFILSTTFLWINYFHMATQDIILLQ